MTLRGRALLVALGLLAAAACLMLAVHFARPAEARVLRVGMTADEAAAAIGRRPEHEWPDTWPETTARLWRLDDGDALVVYFARVDGRVEGWEIVTADVGPLRRLLSWFGR